MVEWRWTDRQTDTYSVYELFPLSLIEAEIVVGDSNLEEFPLSLSLHHLSGKLSGSRRVGVRKETNLINWGEREGESLGEKEVEVKPSAQTVPSSFPPSPQCIADPMEMLHLCVSKGNLWTSILQVLTTLMSSSEVIIPSWDTYMYGFWGESSFWILRHKNTHICSCLWRIQSTQINHELSE